LFISLLTDSIVSSSGFVPASDENRRVLPIWTVNNVERKISYWETLILICTYWQLIWRVNWPLQTAVSFSFGFIPKQIWPPNDVTFTCTSNMVIEIANHIFIFGSLCIELWKKVRPQRLCLVNFSKTIILVSDAYWNVIQPFDRLILLTLLPSLSDFRKNIWNNFTCLFIFKRAIV